MIVTLPLPVMRLPIRACGIARATASAGKLTWAAARATDLTNLPPAYIPVGALDLFVDENIEYAQRLIQAGVPTELHVYPGAFHGFDLFAPSAMVSKQFKADRDNALKRALHDTTRGSRSAAARPDYRSRQQCGEE